MLYHPELEQWRQQHDVNIGLTPALWR
jgi:hypothetical protein